MANNFNRLTLRKISLTGASLLAGFACTLVLGEQILNTAEADSAAPPLSLAFSGDFSGRLAEHIYTPVDLASQKLLMEMNEAIKWGNWSGNFGFRGWDEGAYATNTVRYPQQVVQNDSRDLRVRDAYIQYKNDGFSLRIGSQQVVWGEAFGFFYSDIVNPKDLREGAFGNLADTRLQTPMVNAKWVAGDFSVQGLFIPQPFFDIIPEPGSDFLFPYGSYSPFPSITVQRQETLPMSSQNFEGGGRMSYLFGNLDVSAFYLSYLDRIPYYTVDSSSTASNLVVDEQHSRIQSAGVTATAELDSLLLRFEGLTTLNRQISTVTATGLGTIETNQDVYVVGMDLPTIELFNMGFQWSQDYLQNAGNYLTRNRLQNLASIHVQRPLFLKQSIQAIYTYETSDGGSRLEANYTVPLSGSVETQWGVNLLTGPSQSDFGRLQEGSRAFVLLKCFFKG